MNLVMGCKCKGITHTKRRIFEKLTDKDVATNYESHCTCQILADYLINIAKQAFYKSRKDYLAICVIIHPSHHLGC